MPAPVAIGPMVASNTTVYYVPPPGHVPNAFVAGLCAWTQVRAPYADMRIREYMKRMQPQDHSATIAKMYEEEAKYRTAMASAAANVATAHEQKMPDALEQWSKYDAAVKQAQSQPLASANEAAANVALRGTLSVEDQALTTQAASDIGRAVDDALSGKGDPRSVQSAVGTLQALYGRNRDPNLKEGGAAKADSWNTEQKAEASQRLSAEIRSQIVRVLGASDAASAAQGLQDLDAKAAAGDPDAIRKAAIIDQLDSLQRDVVGNLGPPATASRQLRVRAPVVNKEIQDAYRERVKENPGGGETGSSDSNSVGGSIRGAQNALGEYDDPFLRQLRSYRESLQAAQGKPLGNPNDAIEPILSWQVAGPPIATAKHLLTSRSRDVQDRYGDLRQGLQQLARTGSWDDAGRSVEDARDARTVGRIEEGNTIRTTGGEGGGDMRLSPERRAAARAELGEAGMDLGPDQAAPRPDDPDEVALGRLGSAIRRMGGGPEQPTIPGNIDLTNRPRVKMPDGSVATVRSLTTGEDGATYVVPTVSGDGRIMSDDEAIKHFERTGRHLGRYATLQGAEDASQDIHEQQAEYIKGDATKPAPVKQDRPLSDADASDIDDMIKRLDAGGTIGVDDMVGQRPRYLPGDVVGSDIQGGRHLPGDVVGSDIQGGRHLPGDVVGGPTKKPKLSPGMQGYINLYADQPDDEDMYGAP